MTLVIHWTAPGCLEAQEVLEGLGCPNPGDPELLGDLEVLFCHEALLSPPRLNRVAPFLQAAPQAQGVPSVPAVHLHYHRCCQCREVRGGRGDLEVPRHPVGPEDPCVQLGRPARHAQVSPPGLVLPSALSPPG